MSASRVTAVATLALALVLTGCTGTPEGTPAARATPSSSPSPSSSASEAMLSGATGRTYIIRTAADRTDVTMHGGHNEPVLEEFGTPGRYVAPQVVPGGPREGLSPDGRWLVLESHAPAPNERSVFLVLTGTLRLERETIDLPGRFTFDAWSPDGNVLYLIEHKPPAGEGHYVVRAYDMRTQKLRPEPIADKRNVEEQMAGQPVARATTPDGAVVATLYVRQGDDHDHGPFVHLLYAADGQALCVDLPHGTPVGPGWGLQHAAGDFVVTRAPRQAAFRIDAVSGEVTRSA